MELVTRRQDATMGKPDSWMFNNHKEVGKHPKAEPEEPACCHIVSCRASHCLPGRQEASYENCSCIAFRLQTTPVGPEEGPGKRGHSRMQPCFEPAETHGNPEGAEKWQLQACLPLPSRMPGHQGAAKPQHRYQQPGGRHLLLLLLLMMPPREQRPSMPQQR